MEFVLEKRDYKMIKLLLSHPKIDLQIISSILLNAIQNGDMKTFQFLLSKVGIDINKKIINFI